MKLLMVPRHPQKFINWHPCWVLTIPLFSTYDLDDALASYMTFIYIYFQSNFVLAARYGPLQLNDLVSCILLAETSCNLRAAGTGFKTGAHISKYLTAFARGGSG